MSNRSLRIFCFSLLAMLLATPVTALARIKLITLPVRQRVEIQLDNQQATLVEEERIVPLVKGVNQVDFSWANTQIDPNSIIFRVIPQVLEKDKDKKVMAEVGGKADEEPLDVKVLSVSYPPNEASLVWQVASNGSGTALVRISYILGNLSKSFNYRAVAAKDEKTLVLREYMRLQNFANEEYGSSEIYAGFGPRFQKPVGINETKEVLVEKFDAVPVKKTYTCDPTEFDYIDRPKNKLRVPMHYVLKNNEENHLGKAALQFGKVRIFQEDGHGSTAFLGEDWGKYTPLDDEMRLYIGTAQDIAVVRTIDKNEQHRLAGNLYDIEVVVKYEIENFKDMPVTLDVSESLRHIRSETFRETGRDVQWEMGKDANFEGGPDKEKSTMDKKIFHVNLPARGADGKAEKIVKKFHFTIKNEW